MPAVGGYKALYARGATVPGLATAPAEGSFVKLLNKLARVDCLIVDDFAMSPMIESERRDFVEFCNDRFDLRSMLLATWNLRS